jgi:hypothetical protein
VFFGRTAVRAAAGALVITLIAAGCGNDPQDGPQVSHPPTQEAPTPSAAPQRSASEEPVKIANLRQLEVRMITGLAPNQIPHWGPGQNDTAFIERTLRLLRDAGVEVKLRSQQVTYAVYASEVTLRITCDQPYEKPVLATAYEPVRWCPGINLDTILVVPQAMLNAGRWAEFSGEYLFHIFAKEFAAALAKSAEGPRLDCYIGLLYRGLAFLLKKPLDTILPPTLPNYQTLPGAQFALKNGRCS